MAGGYASLTPVCVLVALSGLALSHEGAWDSRTTTTTTTSRTRRKRDNGTGHLTPCGGAAQFPQTGVKRPALSRGAGAAQAPAGRKGGIAGPLGHCVRDARSLQDLRSLRNLRSILLAVLRRSRPYADYPPFSLFSPQMPPNENFSFTPPFLLIFPSFSPVFQTLPISNKHFILNNLSQKQPFTNASTAASSLQKVSLRPSVKPPFLTTSPMLQNNIAYIDDQHRLH